MKIAWIADTHVGNHRLLGGPLEAGVNYRCQLVVAALANAVQQAVNEGCTHLIGCGDLFDAANPAPQVVAAVQRVLVRGEALGLEIILLKGNHDIVTEAGGDHALGPLERQALIVESPQRVQLEQRRPDPEQPGARRRVLDSVELWAVPFQPGAAAEWLPSVLAGMQGDSSKGSPPASPQRILALHLGLQDGKTPPWLQGAHDSIEVEVLADLLEKHGIRWCFAGNWHEPQQWEFHGPNDEGPRSQVTQVGCTAPTGWDNPGLKYGTMAILDTGTGKLPRILEVPGPRFVASASEAESAVKKGCQVFVRLKDGTPEEAAAAVKAGAQHVEVRVDDGEAQAQLRTAAALARSADNVDEAVANYVATMPISPELRAEVLARVKRFLGGAT